MKFRRQRSGFTLIELLFVISIIGVLSSIVLSSLSNARLKAYDSKRKQELRSISTALQLYFDNTNNGPINRSQGFGYPDYSLNFLQELINAGLLGATPKAPTNDAVNPYYYYNYPPGSIPGIRGGVMLMATQLEGANPQFAPYPGSCRPFDGVGVTANWCDVNISSTWYCLCTIY